MKTCTVILYVVNKSKKSWKSCTNTIGKWEGHDRKSLVKIVKHFLKFRYEIIHGTIKKGVMSARVCRTISLTLTRRVVVEIVQNIPNQKEFLKSVINGGA
jgi:hypothetical protein